MIFINHKLWSKKSFAFRIFSKKLRKWLIMQVNFRFSIASIYSRIDNGSWRTVRTWPRMGCCGALHCCWYGWWRNCCNACSISWNRSTVHISHIQFPFQISTTLHLKYSISFLNIQPFDISDNQCCLWVLTKALIFTAN